MGKPAQVRVADLPGPVQDSLRMQGRVSLRLLEGGLVELEQQEGGGASPATRRSRLGRMAGSVTFLGDVIEPIDVPWGADP